MRRFAVILMFVCALVACSKVDRQYVRTPGSEIVFGCRTSNIDGLTKTLYSGSVVGGIERIEWVAGDMIRVFSPEVTSPANHYGDYAISEVTASETARHGAKIVASGSALRWGEATDYSFCAVYPSPKVNSSVSVDGTGFSATIPSAQMYPADMKYGYLAAYATAERADDATDPVALSFAPVTTTLSFQLVNTSETAQMSFYDFSVSSVSSALCGDFSASVTSGVSCTCPSWTTSNSVLSVDLGGSSNPTTVNAGESITITLFALPADLSGLSIILNTDEGEKILALKQNGSFITFPARCKSSIRNIGVPEGRLGYLIKDFANHEPASGIDFFEW